MISIAEIKRIKEQISKCEKNLANEKFLENASQDVKEREIEKLNDFQMLLNMYVYNFKIKLKEKFGSHERMMWQIESMREKYTEIPLYTKEWFDYVYNENVEPEEFYYLANE